MIQLCGLIAGLLPALPLQQPASTPPRTPTSLEEWGAQPEEAQLATLAAFVEGIGPRMEMDVCYPGELLLRAKSIEVSRAVLGLAPGLPSEVELQTRQEGVQPAFEVCCIPDYGRALEPWGAELCDYDAWVLGAYQAQVLAFLDAQAVDTVVLPASLGAKTLDEVAAAPSPEAARGVLLQALAARAPAERSLQELFPNGRVEGEATSAQCLALGRYGAPLVRLLAREDVRPLARLDSAFLEAHAKAVATAARPGGALALPVEVARPGDPRLPAELLGDGHARWRVQEVRWKGERPYLQWHSSMLGARQLLERVDFDLADLSRYLDAQTEATPKEETRWKLLCDSWILAVQQLPALPAATARWLPPYREALGTGALDAFLARAGDFLVRETELLDERRQSLPLREYLLHWAGVRGYPETSLEGIRELPLDGRWKLPAGTAR